MSNNLRLAVIGIQEVSAQNREHMVSCVDNDDYVTLQTLLSKVMTENNKYSVEFAESLLPSATPEEMLEVYLINN